jgi:hypothetical protein
MSIPADAGTSAGAFVAAPTITAEDDCDGALAPQLTITYPGGGIAQAWPASGYFPVGTSQVSVSAIDGAGNSATQAFSITVANHQLLDADVTFTGTFTGASTRSIRFTTGSTSTIKQIAFDGTAGSASAVEIPVAATHVCITAKDTLHSVSASAVPSVAGLRWAASFVLHQGDSNDDNAVDVLDFGVEDPQGFRGWGGGNVEPAVIGVQAASRSYLPGPLPAYMGNGFTHGLKCRHSAFDIGGVAPNHDAEGAFGCAFTAATDWRVEHLNALGVEFGGDFNGGLGADGATIDHQRAFLCTMNHAILAQDHIFYVWRITNTGDDDVAVGRHIGRACPCDGTCLNQGINAASGAVPHPHLVAGREQAPHHGRAHQAQAAEGELHGATPRPAAAPARSSSASGAS